MDVKILKKFILFANAGNKCIRETYSLPYFAKKVVGKEKLPLSYQYVSRITQLYASRYHTLFMK